MVHFEFCQECTTLDQDQMPYDLVKICDRCFHGRKEYLRQIQRDKAYRSHIARQMAGYPCDASSGCPYHSPTYQFYTPSDEHFYQYMQLIKNALDKFERCTYSSITALELLSTHYLSLVRYCGSCYDGALDGFEQNLQISLCDGCLARREAYINDVHNHQNSFLEPWERRTWPLLLPGHVWAREIDNAPGLEYDRYLSLAVLDRCGGGGRSDPATLIGLVFGGLAAPALIVALAGVVYSRRQWRLAQETQRDGQGIHVLNQLASDLTSGRVTITRQDVENASNSSFHTAETHLG